MSDQNILYVFARRDSVFLFFDITIASSILPSRVCKTMKTQIGNVFTENVAEDKKSFALASPFKINDYA